MIVVLTGPCFSEWYDVECGQVFSKYTFMKFIIREAIYIPQADFQVGRFSIHFIQFQTFIRFICLIFTYSAANGVSVTCYGVVMIPNFINI